MSHSMYLLSKCYKVIFFVGRKVAHTKSNEWLRSSTEHKILTYWYELTTHNIDFQNFQILF